MSPTYECNSQLKHIHDMNAQRSRTEHARFKALLCDASRILQCKYSTQLLSIALQRKTRSIQVNLHFLSCNTGYYQLNKVITSQTVIFKLLLCSCQRVLKDARLKKNKLQLNFLHFLMNKVES